jgi:hypothetical protein
MNIKFPGSQRMVFLLPMQQSPGHSTSLLLYWNGLIQAHKPEAGLPKQEGKNFSSKLYFIN